MYGARLHVPALHVELRDTVEQAAPDGAFDEYDVQVPPFDAAEQPPEAAQPAVQELYAYGAGLQELFEHVEVSETVEHAAPDGAVEEYVVHVPPCEAEPQPPDALQPQLVIVIIPEEILAETTEFHSAKVLVGKNISWEVLFVNISHWLVAL